MDGTAFVFDNRNVFLSVKHLLRAREWMVVSVECVLCGGWAQASYGGSLKYDSCGVGRGWWRISDGCGVCVEGATCVRG